MSYLTFSRKENTINLSPRTYILYVGRMIPEKNVDLLAEYTAELHRNGVDLQVVFAGVGQSYYDLREKYTSSDGVELLGHVTEEEKSVLYENALCLANLSTLESFSLTIMEAWRHGRPVVVNKACAVTRYHVEESGGGVVVDGPVSFAIAAMRLMHDPTAASDAGARGAEYVRQRYSAASVNARVMQAFEWVSGQEAR